MATAPRYKVVPLTPEMDNRGVTLEQITHVLYEHAEDGWELITGFQHLRDNVLDLGNLRIDLRGGEQPLVPTITLIFKKQP